MANLTNTVVVAGATGNLGKRIVKALQEQSANVVALVRSGTAQDKVQAKVQALEGVGAKTVLVDLSDVEQIARACAGAGCLVSAVQGLHDVIVDVQKTLLQAAIAAGVPRFIPSDFSTDFTKLPPGDNRNFDLRREFHQHLDVAPISSTSIFNGAFGEILTYNIPLLDFKQKTVGYWEDAEWLIDFTTMDDTAAYTAAAALDPTTPRALNIASFQISPRQIAALAEEIFQARFELKRLGSLAELRDYNRQERAAHPEGENELYPAWQQTQYMQSMFSTHHSTVDNARYSRVHWSAPAGVVSKRY